MSEVQKTKVKKVLPAVILATSFYYSFLFAFGLLLGYFAAKIYCKKLNIDENSDRRIFIELGENWKIHLHHWILGIIALALVWVIDYFYLPTFFVGAIAGIVAHDIYDYNDWYKVLIKSKPEN